MRIILARPSPLIISYVLAIADRSICAAKGMYHEVRSGPEGKSQADQAVFLIVS